MDIAVVIIGDGRAPYLAQAVASIEQHIPESVIEATVMVNDTGDTDYMAYLNVTYPQITRFVHHQERRGLAGAVQSAWETALKYDVDYIWHHEEDFILNATVPIAQIAYLLSQHPHLAQCVLQRQPWSPEELAAGGVVQSALEDHTECRDGDLVWTEHSRLFGYNPCLIPRHIIEDTLDLADNFLERGVTDLWVNAGYRFAYWGGIGDAPLAHHIGNERSSGYRW